VGAPFSIDTEADGYSLDLQQIHTTDRWRLQSGLVYAQRDSVGVTQVMFPGPPPISATTTSRSTYEQRSLYGYAHWLIAPTLTVTAGASADALTDEFIDAQAVNPKVGLIWQPTARLTLRMAVYETLQGTLTTSPQNPQPRLEPVQIAGFSQLVFGGTADASMTRGIALDHALSERLFAGIEVTQRDFDRTLLLPSNPPESVVQAFATAERSQHAYVYWTPLDQLSVSAQYQHDRLHSAPFDTFGYADMNLKRLPIELHHFAPFGLTTMVRASHVLQTGNFSLAPQPGVEYGEDQFWVLDASIGYRLRNRRGMLSLHVDNLLDTDFRFQDIDPENPSIMPERMLAFRFTVAFD
jgi:outer membrane receptor protein involved in Fe transport